MKRTYQPNTRKRKKKHGFLQRMRTRNGRKIIANRRRKGRKVLSAWLPEDKIKIEGIKSKKEFREILDSGQKINTRFFLTYIKKTEERNCFKIGFIITKKIGNAVVRNKIKRRVKEALRDIGFSYDTGISIVFIARKAIVGADYLNIIEALGKLLKNI